MIVRLNRTEGRGLLFVCGVPLTTQVFAAMEACTASGREATEVAGQ
jgi:hypothetical protein